MWEASPRAHILLAACLDKMAMEEIVHLDVGMACCESWLAAEFYGAVKIYGFLFLVLLTCPLCKCHV